MPSRSCYAINAVALVMIPLLQLLLRFKLLSFELLLHIRCDGLCCLLQPLVVRVEFVNMCLAIGAHDR